MFVLGTDKLFLLSFGAISCFKGKWYLLDIFTTDVGETGTFIVLILKSQSNAALISEGKFL